MKKGSLEGVILRDIVNSSLSCFSEVLIFKAENEPRLLYRGIFDFVPDSLFPRRVQNFSVVPSDNSRYSMQYLIQLV